MSDFYEGRMIPLKIADQAIISCNKEIEKLQIENALLKVEVERLMAFTTRTIIPNEELEAENALLKVEVERLTDAITSGNAITPDAHPQP